MLYLQVWSDVILKLINRKALNLSDYSFHIHYLYKNSQILLV